MYQFISAASQAARMSQASSATPPALAQETVAPVPDYTAMGPLQAQRLPKLEHTCSQCFPACQTNKCLLRTEVWYPKGGTALGLAPPYPLAIFSSGFMVSSEVYQSYAQVLASWGYTVILYDKTESAVDAIDDELSARFISVRTPQTRSTCASYMCTRQHPAMLANPTVRPSQHISHIPVPARPTNAPLHHLPCHDTRTPAGSFSADRIREQPPRPDPAVHSLPPVHGATPAAAHSRRPCRTSSIGRAATERSGRSPTQRPCTSWATPGAARSPRSRPCATPASPRCACSTQWTIPCSRRSAPATPPRPPRSGTFRTTGRSRSQSSVCFRHRPRAVPRRRCGRCAAAGEPHDPVPRSANSRMHAGPRCHARAGLLRHVACSRETGPRRRAPPP